MKLTRRHQWSSWTVDGYLRRIRMCVAGHEGRCAPCSNSGVYAGVPHIAIDRKKLKRKVNA